MAKRKIKGKRGGMTLEYRPPDLPKLKPEQLVNINKLAGDGLVAIIRRQTGQGVNADLQPFQPYSPLYQRIKSGANKYVGHVNMRVTGSMLNDLQVIKHSRTRFTLGFSDTSRPTPSTMLEDAWGDLSKEDRSAIWGYAMAAKAKTGKRRGVSGRRSPVAKKSKVAGPPISGAPAPTNSEKAEWTNRLRPWLTIGPIGGARYNIMQTFVARLVARALKERV